MNPQKIDLSFSSQNCNSLNVSTSIRSQTAKITGIIGLDTDVIVLSDTRFNGRYRYIEDAFRLSYKMIHNSSLNRRGVAVLFKNNLQYDILEEVRDNQENILGLRLQINNRELCICAVYGPNTNDMSFYDFLDNLLNRWRHLPIVVAGDWNATFSDLPVNLNPDVFSMRAVPSTVRTARILQICQDMDLTDPFRALHPDERDFTYVPSGVLRTNRSRIDFFLVSESLFPELHSCTIAQSFCRRSFDHKPIRLSFKKDRKKGRPCVNNRILDNPLLECAVKLSIWESYLEVVDFLPGGLVEAIFTDQCQKLAIIEDKFNASVLLRGKLVTGDLTDEEEIEVTDLAESMEEEWTQVLSYDALQLLPRYVDDDCFFESLIKKTTSAALSLQKSHSLAESGEKSRLISSLRDLKKNGGFDTNFDLICEIESKLNSIEERINNDKVQNYLKTDVLNNERITPFFLRIAKTINNDSLTKIKKPCNGEFISHREREQYISKFYKDLYTVPVGAPINYDGCIENFLGADICAHPLVLNSKLTDEEKADLDSPLTLTELDGAVKKLNLRSAPGIDGVSNKFILKFWKFFREPLHRYATCCVRKGELTGTFSTALIRLIPKKGDTCQIKNWRPISLLSCYYKIISKALNLRLGKVIDKVTSSAQKAYNPKRFIHEALINTIESISHCHVEAIDGLLVSVDLHKAFDSLYHGFMREVYKFFGFGEYFIKLSETLGNNRTAKIIFDSGNFSESINLECGRPQGDGPSPRQFNMAQQICIIKIECDPVIKSVYLNFIVPRPMGVQHEVRRALATDQGFELAVERGLKVSEELKTTNKKVSGFADDLTGSVVAEFETMDRFKLVLTEFGLVSGLRTNVEKTAIMRIGSNVLALDPRISALGFNCVEKMKILGIEINNNPENLSTNFDSCILKMTRICANWNRYRLSLPGRISIAKAFLLSQLSYPGAILQPTAVQLDVMTELIEGFVTCNVVIAKDRIYTKVKNGGLGMIRLGNFLDSLKCGWIRRCASLLNDPWRWEFSEHADHMLDNIRLNYFDKTRHPLMWNIASSVCKFQLAFWNANENFRNAPLFENVFFLKERPGRRAQNPGPVRLNLTRAALRDICKEKILNMRISDFFEGNLLVGHRELCLRTNIPFNYNEYMSLLPAVNFAKTKYMDRPNSNGKTLRLMPDLYSRKGNSKIFRLYLDSAHPEKNIAELRTGRTFFGLIGCESSEEEILCDMYSLWNCHALPNKIKVFCFQFFNNSLATGPRLAGRYRNNANVDIDERCSFCVRSGVGVPAREDFYHIFAGCPAIKRCVDMYVAKYGDGTDTADGIKRFLFTGSATRSVTSNSRLNLLSNMLFMYGIWMCKLGKKVPNFTTLENNFCLLFDNSLSIGKKLTNKALIGTSPVCRLWRERHGRG